MFDERTVECTMAKLERAYKMQNDSFKWLKEELGKELEEELDKCKGNLKRTKEMFELDECPFCGGDARILHGGLKFMATVKCCDCGAEIKVIDEDDPVKLAVEKWNRRK